MKQKITKALKRMLVPPDADQKLIEAVQGHTYLSPAKLLSLKRIAALLDAKGVKGDFVECGTYRGGSAAVLASTLAPDRHLWLFDSFEGMPDTKPVDGIEAKKWVGDCRATPENVLEAFQKMGVSHNRYSIRKGWFQDTFKEELPQQVALIHCDADWYDSVTTVLETFYPRLSDGGCVILDDFGQWEGCRVAFYDFCHKHGEKPLLERVDTDQAFWFKGREHNRS